MKEEKEHKRIILQIIYLSVGPQPFVWFTLHHTREGQHENRAH
jgi:hypothetical protein